MKKQATVRLRKKCPLFVFCKEQLQSKQADKVRDQAVGQLLGFTPVDTSNWKRGRRQIRHVEHYIKLSKEFNVPVEQLYEISTQELV